MNRIKIIFIISELENIKTTKILKTLLIVIAHKRQFA